MNNIPVVCSKCGAIIGNVITVNQIKLLKIGSLVVRSVHGACVCGQEFHFTSNDAMLADLLVRMLLPCVVQ